MFERRRIELRADGRTIHGVVMRYGAEATVIAPDGRIVRERFQPGSFAGYLAEFRTLLNLQHDRSIEIASTDGGDRGTLELFDGAEELRMVATLPPGDAYDAALALVAEGATAETSVEFRALAERIEGDRRTILQATLPAVGLVDAGAYRGAVEVRRAQPAPEPRRRRWWL